MKIKAFWKAFDTNVADDAICTQNKQQQQRRKFLKQDEICE